VQTRATIPPAVAEWLPAMLGLVALYVPTYVDLARTLWASDDQAHGPIILAVALFFFWQKHRQINELPAASATAGWPVFITGLLLYILGRSQDILIFEVGSQILVIASLLLLQRGWAAIRILWFPLLFLIFMVPLPGGFVDALTLPMKMAVSWAAEYILYDLGYPISRSGVILQIGQYKLLVADACAGLHTLFTLEALGLLYLHVVRHESWLRNTLLAIAIVPISFTANTIRVIALTLVTFHLGDEAGQGFLHGFAGMVLFVSALLLIIAIDSALQFAVSRFGVRSTA
jgi:exosortase B